jgi:hypothetical protein
MITPRADLYAANERVILGVPNIAIGSAASD